MRNKGWTLSIIVLASLAFVAIALALVAQPADATITGKPLPSYGNDWIIDQDTTVLGESIKLQGNITIEGGNTLSVRNTEIKINSTYQGEHGIYVETNSTNGDGVLELDDCTFRSDYAANGWTFEVRGALKIVKARLYNVENGLQIYSDNVDVVNMTIYAQGYYGIYIEKADPKIHDSAIYAMGYYLGRFLREGSPRPGRPVRQGVPERRHLERIQLHVHLLRHGGRGLLLRSVRQAVEHRGDLRGHSGRVGQLLVQSHRARVLLRDGLPLLRRHHPGRPGRDHQRQHVLRGRGFECGRG
jgi:hypothetical protein